MRVRACLIVLASLSAPLALAQAPDLTAPEGSVLTRAIESELDEYQLPVGPFGQETPTVTLTGAVKRQAWRMPAGGQSVLAVMRDLRDDLRHQGFRRILDCSGDACGGFDFRFGADLMPPPDMAMDVRDFAQLSVGREAPSAYASVLVSRVRDWIYIQLVTVVPEDPDMALASKPMDKRVRNAPEPERKPEPRPDDEPAAEEGDLTLGAFALDPPAIPDDAGAAVVDDETAFVTDVVGGIAPPDDTDTPPDEATVAAPVAGLPDDDGSRASDQDVTEETPIEEPTLLETLKKDGHVTVQGLVFETSGVGLTAGSAPALDDMAKMLIENTALSVAIVGHSDNVGPLRINIDISRRRAESVRSALIERGVSADRLEARGVGYLAPRRSNATPEGRAMNRRVELVLRENPDPEPSEPDQ